MSSPVFVSDSVACQVLTWPAMIAGLTRTYSVQLSPQVSPPRSMARADGRWMRTLTGLDPSGRYMGVKQFGLSRQKRLTYMISLFDQDSGDLVALLDGHGITALRTAATSAVAVDRLAPPGPVRLAVLGSGTEAHSHVRAIAAIRPIEEMTVFSTNGDRRNAFAALFAEELGVPCRAAATPLEAVDRATMIVGATRTRDGKPVLHGDWVKDDVLVVSIGATLREQREVDVDCIARSDLIVADNPHEVMSETGCFLDAAAAGVTFLDKFISLNDLVMGRADDRVGAARRIIYRSVGGPLQDIAVAEQAFDAAVAQGLATALPMTFSVKQD